MSVTFLPNPQRSVPPTQFHLRLSAQAKFVICDCTIEHAFRFLKQHLGLNANQATTLTSIDTWMWLCALAYTQLLLMRAEVEANRPAWHRAPAPGQPAALTPGQVQRSATRFLLKLGTPAPPPRPAGKGTGRPQGFSPQPRPRFRVVRKTKKRAKPRQKQAV